MTRLWRASVVATLCLLTSAAIGFAADGWVLWRHYVPVYSPDIDDARMWRAQPGAKTRRECESEMKEFQQGDPGREYRIEYHCLPDTVDPRLPKGKVVASVTNY